MHHFVNNNGGFIKLIIFIIIGLLVISYLGVDLRSTVESQKSKDNFSYVWGYTKAFWNNYLDKPASWLWQNIIIDIVWNKVVKPGIESVKNDKFLDLKSNGQGQSENTLPPNQ